MEIVNNGIDEELRGILFDYQKLASANIHLKRGSQDKGRANSFGYKLIGFCRRCNMYIANGHICQDRDLGKTTSNDCSLIDYLIVSSNLLKDVKEFKIEDNNPLFSDAHNLLHVSIPMNLSYKEKENNHKREYKTKFKWNMSKANEFADGLNIEEESIQTLCNQIDNFSSEEHGIDGILNKLEHTFKEAAIKSFGKADKISEYKQNPRISNQI